MNEKSFICLIHKRMPSEMTKKALKDGLITQKQYDKLPEKLLEGIVKSKKGGGKKKRKKRKSKK